MLVKCKESFRQQLKANNLYIVIEVLVKLTTKSISYRIIDEERFPAIYDSVKFDIVSNQLSQYSISITDEDMVLSPSIILNSELYNKHVDGFWGLFFDDDKEAISLLENMVNILASTEGVPSPLFERKALERTDQSFC